MAGPRGGAFLRELLLLVAFFLDWDSRIGGGQPPGKSQLRGQLKACANHAGAC
jgi:hypothetical protein